MPKLPRVTVVQFGATGSSSNFGQFGSKTAGTPQTSQNPSVLMQLAAWGLGWTSAAVGAAFNPYLEDVNGVDFVFGYLLTSLFERGVPDWDTGTTYYKGAVVQDPAGSGQLFESLTDNNIAQALPLGASNAQWRWINPAVATVGGTITAGVLPKATAGTPLGGYTGSKPLADSAVSDDGVNVGIALPLKFPDATIQTTAAAPTSSQAVVTGSRAQGIVYQNTSPRPMFVAVSGAVGGTRADAYTDANAAPVTNVCHCSGSTSSPDMQLFFIVLPGNYYKVTGFGNIGEWTEWV